MFDRYFKVREYQNRTQHEKIPQGLILGFFSPDGKPEQPPDEFKRFESNQYFAKIQKKYPPGGDPGGDLGDMVFEFWRNIGLNP